MYRTGELQSNGVAMAKKSSLGIELAPWVAHAILWGEICLKYVFRCEELKYAIIFVTEQHLAW